MITSREPPRTTVLLGPTWSIHRAVDSFSSKNNVSMDVHDRSKRNDPPATQERRLIPSEEHKQQNESAMKTTMDLDDASLGTVLDFLPGHFRFVASANRRFRFLSTTHHTPSTFYTVAMTSGTTRAIWFEEQRHRKRVSFRCAVRQFGSPPMASVSRMPLG